MLAVVQGTVMKTYVFDTHDRDGKPCKVNRCDLYDGDELLKVTRLPDIDTVLAGSVVTMRVKVYGGDRGLTLVYDDLL